MSVKKAGGTQKKTPVRKKEVDQRKKRTLTGCETCRNRKIKCDGLRPQCTRCIKSNIECGGYGIKLKFCNVLVVDKSGEMTALESKEPDTVKYQRRAVPFMKFVDDSEIYANFKEMDPDLDSLDELQNLIHDEKRGPFRLLKLNLKGAKSELPPLSEILKPHGTINAREMQPPLILKPNDSSSVAQQLNTAFSMSLLREAGQSQKKPDVVVARSIWIHPRLKIDAMLTYQTLIGSCDVINNDWDDVQRTIFSELYNTSDKFKNRIIDKMNLDDSLVNSEISKRSNDVVRALSVNTLHIPMWYTFTKLLTLHRVQELVRLFVKSQPNIMYLSYNGCLFDKLLIPFLYKTVGELLVFESSLGMNGGGDVQFNKYCDVLKRAFCMISLSITSFSQYKMLFHENAIYDASLCYFKSFIAFREMALIYLAKLLKPLVKENNTEIVLGQLFKAGLLKEFTITVIMAIYQDSYVDIINNYKLLFGILEDVKIYYSNLNFHDEQMDSILLWFRYMNVFFKTCSTIDLENYEVDDEGFEDLRSDYDLSKKFSPYLNHKEDESENVEINCMNVADQGISLGAERQGNTESKSFTINFQNILPDNEHKDNTDISRTENKALHIKDGKRVIVNQIPHQSIDIPIPSDPKFGQTGVSTVEMSYGIPISLLELIERALVLADHRNWFLRKNIHPRNFPKFCCDLEEDLMNWKLPWDLYSLSSDGRLVFHSLFHKALYHLTITVYNTTLLFFFRLIKDVDPILFQDRVISTIEQLEDLKRLSMNGNFLRDMKIAPPFWCFFLVGSDAIDPSVQQRFDELGRTWFVAGHKWIGKQIMMEIWRSRNDEQEQYEEKEISWIDMIKGWEISGYN